MPEKNSNNRGFLNFGILTIVAVYFLILVGGIVRSTGSGMGCPDWPKCFGKIIPPTDISQLPGNYQELYAEKRLNKNKRLAVLLDKFGFQDLANKIVNDPSMYVEAEFNATKTWIEYLNRLVGVAVGLLIISVVYYSFRFLKSDSVIFWLSFLSLVLVIFEGWLGSIVVSTNLLPGTISVHMGLALVIVILLTYVIIRSHKSYLPTFIVANSGFLQFLLIGMLLLSFIQILVGTQIRESIDIIAGNFVNQRNLWVSKLGIIFPVHRILSIIILGLHLVYIYYIFNKITQRSIVTKISVALIAVLFLEILSGLMLNYAGFPAFIQPVHLLLANLLIGMQFLLFILMRYNSLNIKIA